MARVSAAFLVLVACLAVGVIAAGPQTSASSAPAFDQLFDQYRRGDAAAAVDAFSFWDNQRVSLEARRPDSTTDSASIAALALFLTETGFRRQTFGGFVEGTPPGFQPFLGPMLFLGDWGLEDIFEPRSFRAHQLIETLVRRAKADRDERLLSFCRSWYILAVSYCERWQLQCTRGLLEEGEHHFGGNDPEYLLLVGSIRQPYVMARWRMRDAWADPTLGQESIAKFKLGPEDVAWMMTFADELALKAGPARDPHTDGGTRMWDALIAAVSLVQNQRGRSLVLLFSDGDDSTSWLDEKRALDTLKRADVVVSAIRPRAIPWYAAPNRNADLRYISPYGLVELEAITETTGGVVLTAEKDARLHEQFVALLDEFRMGYLLSFTPTRYESRKDGWHRVEVKLKDKPGTVRRGPGITWRAGS